MKKESKDVIRDTNADLVADNSTILETSLFQSSLNFVNLKCEVVGLSNVGVLCIFLPLI